MCFHVRFAHTLQILFLDELCDVRELRPHVLRQGLDLCVNGFIQGLDRPSHVSIYQKRYSRGPSFKKERVRTVPLVWNQIQSRLISNSYLIRLEALMLRSSTSNFSFRVCLRICVET